MTWFLISKVEGVENRYYPVVGVFGEDGAKIVDIYRAKTTSWRKVDADLDAYLPTTSASLTKAGGHWDDYKHLSALLAHSPGDLVPTDSLERLLFEFPWSAAKFSGITVSLDADGNIDEIFQNGRPVTGDDNDDAENEDDLEEPEDSSDDSDTDEDESSSDAKHSTIYIVVDGPDALKERLRESDESLLNRLKKLKF